MKKTRFLWAAALVIALVAMLAACPADEGLSLPGKAGDVSAVTSFTGQNKPAKESDAISLLINALMDLDTLSELNEEAFKNANSGKSFWEWLDDNKTSKSVSLSVKFTAANNGFTGDYSKVKITGSSDGSYSGNITLEDYMDYTREEKAGDTVTMKTSFNKTADFRDTKITGSSYEFYGIIKAESKGTKKDTVKKAEIKDGSTTVEYAKSETSGSSVDKVSAVLSISDGATTAKYKFSYASEGSSKDRKADSSNESILSDIEIYDSGDNLLWKSKSNISDISDNASGLVSLFSDFGGGF